MRAEQRSRAGYQSRAWQGRARAEVGARYEGMGA